MVNVAPSTIPLRPHPTTQSDAIQSLDVQLSFGSPSLVTLRYHLRGDMSRIRVGAAGVPGRADDLWKHTCFEAFIRPAGSAQYYELNFSPTEQWAAYHFDSYRAGMTPADLSRPPEMAVRRSAGSLELEVTFLLPAGCAATPRPKLALTAVVEEEGGRLCYWSVRHPPGRPDFHHAAGFTIDL